jgi:hypothetical protein
LLNNLDFIVISQFSNTVAIYEAVAILECSIKTKDVSFLFEINFDRIFIDLNREFFYRIFEKNCEIGFLSLI